jgi:hypothetical protein
VRLNLVLGRGEEVTVSLPEIRVYNNGLELVIRAVGDDRVIRASRPSVGLLSEHCSLTVGYPNGRAAALRCDAPPEVGESAPQTSFNGGSGEPDRVDVQFFVWPLPSPGAITLTCKRPQARIASTQTRIDADQLLATARDAPPLWPDIEQA